MIKRFLSYIEIKTKITSVLTFLYVLAFLNYFKIPIQVLPTVVFFTAMFLFDLVTTAINNYIDTKTNDQTLQFKRRTARIIIYVLFALSVGISLYLVWLTDLVVLFLGMLCFLCGILYTAGPAPISRMPLGEPVSGIFYGFFIPLILVYINMPENSLLGYSYINHQLNITFDIPKMAVLILLCATPTFLTANIMLANNTCDVEKDVKVNRFTLPYYIGKKHAVRLFAVLYYLIYAVTVLLVVLQVVTPWYLLTFLTFPIVQKNISTFYKKQEKETTFHTAILNFIIIIAFNTLVAFILSLIN